MAECLKYQDFFNVSVFSIVLVVVRNIILLCTRNVSNWHNINCNNNTF